MGTAVTQVAQVFLIPAEQETTHFGWTKLWRCLSSLCLQGGNSGRPRAAERGFSRDETSPRGHCNWGLQEFQPPSSTRSRWKGKERDRQPDGPAPWASRPAGLCGQSFLPAASPSESRLPCSVMPGEPETAAQLWCPCNSLVAMH